MSSSYQICRLCYRKKVNKDFFVFNEKTCIKCQSEFYNCNHCKICFFDNPKHAYIHKEFYCNKKVKKYNINFPVEKHKPKDEFYFMNYW